MVDYSMGLKALAEAIDEVRRSMREEIEALVDEIRRKVPRTSQVTEELSGLERRINEVQDLAEQTGEGSAVSKRLGEVEEELKALKEGEYDYDAIAGLTGRLEERIVENTERLNGAERARDRLEGSLVEKARSIERLSQENEELLGHIESVRNDLNRLVDSHNKLGSLVENLESRVGDLEGGNEPTGSQRAGSEGAGLSPTSAIEVGLKGPDPQDSSHRRSPEQESPEQEPPHQPSWHDSPPESGAYVYVVEGRRKAAVIRVIAPDAHRPDSGEHFYGPIPEGPVALETYV